jgi:hypothetical protein
MPNDPDLTLGQKAARRPKARIIVGLFVLMSGLPPLSNAMSNPAMSNPLVATLHGSDVMGLLASGLCLGFGLALLISRLIFRGE